MRLKVLLAVLCGVLLGALGVRVYGDCVTDCQATCGGDPMCMMACWDDTDMDSIPDWCDEDHCPDSDSDGLCDFEDGCPDDVGSEHSSDGCPCKWVSTWTCDGLGWVEDAVPEWGRCPGCPAEPPAPECPCSGADIGSTVFSDCGDEAAPCADPDPECISWAIYVAVLSGDTLVWVDDDPEAVYCCEPTVPTFAPSYEGQETWKDWDCEEEPDPDPDDPGGEGWELGSCCLTRLQWIGLGRGDSTDWDGDGIPNSDDECPYCAADCYQQATGMSEGGEPQYIAKFTEPVEWDTSGACKCQGCPYEYLHSGRGGTVRIGGGASSPWSQPGCQLDTDWDEDGVNNEDDTDCEITCKGCSWCGRVEDQVARITALIWDRFPIAAMATSIDDTLDGSKPVLNIPLPSSIGGVTLPQTAITIDYGPWFGESSSAYSFLAGGVSLLRLALFVFFILAMLPRFIKALEV